MEKVWVCLTSISENLPSLYHTLTSLLNQSMKPDHIILCLSTNAYLQDNGFPNYNIPKWLDDMKEVHILWVNNFGPYRKLLPVLQQLWETNDIIITCDDDTIYDRHFVKKLVRAYEKEKCCVAYRCKEYGRDIKYNEMQKGCGKSVWNFHTGKGGVLYTPKFFHGTNIFSDRFLDLCPYNDDIWFNFLRMKNNIPCLVLEEKWMIEDLTHRESALWFNYNKDMNNEQMKKTFDFIFGEKESTS